MYLNVIISNFIGLFLKYAYNIFFSIFFQFFFFFLRNIRSLSNFSIAVSICCFFIFWMSKIIFLFIIFSSSLFNSFLIPIRHQFIILLGISHFICGPTSFLAVPSKYTRLSHNYRFQLRSNFSDHPIYNAHSIFPRGREEKTNANYPSQVGPKSALTH